MSKENLREVILLRLADVAPSALRTRDLLYFVSNSGFPDLDEKTLAAELDYLVQKNCVVAEPGKLAAGVVHWRLGAEGRDYLEGKGLLKS